MDQTELLLLSSRGKSGLKKHLSKQEKSFQVPWVLRKTASSIYSHPKRKKRDPREPFFSVGCQRSKSILYPASISRCALGPLWHNAVRRTQNKKTSQRSAPRRHKKKNKKQTGQPELTAAASSFFENDKSSNLYLRDDGNNEKKTGC